MNDERFELHLQSITFNNEQNDEERYNYVANTC